MKNLSPKEAITILEGMRIDIPVPKAAVTQIKRNLALDMAINALNCSEIPNNWIPCSVRLPEDDTEVLVYLFENNKSPYIAWLSDGRWYTEDFEVEQENEPVAWMPLPEPYQKRGEQK